MKKLLSAILVSVLLILQMFTIGYANIVIRETWDSDNHEIIRIYEIGEGEYAANVINRRPFTRNGLLFEFASITESPIYSSREHAEIITAETRTRDLETIMRELATEMYFETDGYYGVLTLDVSSINIQSRGTQSSTHTATKTRKFPHLSTPDTSLVPRSITEGNRTFELYNVEWRTQTTTAVDYVQLPATFTAVATYTGTETRTHTIGYTTTAEYRGTISRQTGATQYTVRYTGIPARNNGFLGIIIASVIIAFAVTFFISKKSKKKPPVKKLTSVGLMLCLMFSGIAQTAYASGIPRNSFGRGQNAVHFNPQSVSGTLNTANAVNVGGLHFSHSGQAFAYNTRIGRLTIERLGRTVNIYVGATMWAMDRGAGWFSFTGLTNGNVGLIGHNRGLNGFFSFVRHLREGDTLMFYANGITRVYAVQSVFTINETDFSPLAQFGDNRLTLVTCVEYQRTLRRVAVAVEI